MTPSFPTFSMASAIRSPMVLSLLAEMVATWAISFLPLVGLEIFLISSTTASTALSIPRLRAMGLASAVTFFTPSRKMAWASTVAVVVPAPATSEVLEATWRTIWAPMFSKGSGSSTSFATVTPSLVMVGAPHFLSRTTLRPLGPRVAFTALESFWTPRKTAIRASSSYNSFLAGMAFLPTTPRRQKPRGASSGKDPQDVVLTHDQVFLVAQLDLAPGPLPEQHAVPDFDRRGLTLAIVGLLPRADSHDLSLLRLLLGSVRNDDPALVDFLFFHALHQNPIAQGAQLDH